MRVLPDIDRHVVIVDRIAYEPIVFCPASGEFLCPSQAAVRNVHQAFWYRDAEKHAVGLVGLVILVRPPHAGSQSLACHRYPWIAAGVLRPRESSLPWRIRCDRRLAAVEHFDVMERVLCEFLR